MIFYTKWKAKREKAYYDSLPEFWQMMYDNGHRYNLCYGDGAPNPMPDPEVVTQRALEHFNRLNKGR